MFAEDRRPNSVLPPLIGRLVGLHAFSQLMTHPLFGRQVYNTETFSPRGAQIIAETKSLADIVRRNLPDGHADAGGPAHAQGLDAGVGHSGPLMAAQRP